MALKFWKNLSSCCIIVVCTVAGQETASTGTGTTALFLKADVRGHDIDCGQGNTSCVKCGELDEVSRC
jgi:hypothetical protein